MKEIKPNLSLVDNPEAREILEQHSDLRGELDRLEKTTEIPRLLPLLRDLRSQLERHFAMEEAPDGLYRAINDAAPRHFNKTESLREEHRELLKALSRVTEKAEACLDGPASEVRREVAQLCRRLREHEITENQLLTDSVCTDLGSGD